MSAGEFPGGFAAAAHSDADVGKAAGGFRAAVTCAAPHRRPHLCGAAGFWGLHPHHHGHHARRKAGPAASRSDCSPALQTLLPVPDLCNMIEMELRKLCT